MIHTIKTAVVDKKAGEAVLYAGLLGLVLANIIPTPADALYFRLMEKNKAKLEKGEITPKQYWTRDAALYYGLNPLWWLLILTIMVRSNADLNTIIKLGLAIVGGGAVIVVLNKNIREEENKKKRQ